MKKALLLLCMTVLGTTPVFAQVVFDVASNSGVQTVASYSWSHTVATGTNLALICAIERVGNYFGDPVLVTSVTYNTVGLTSIRSDYDGASQRIDFFRLVAPATGANTVAVTLNGIPGSGSVSGCWSASTVDQTTPVDIQNSASGNSVTAAVTLTGTATGSIYLQSVTSSLGGTLTVGDGATQDWNPTTIAAGAHKSAGGDVIPSWSIGSGGSPWLITAISLKPASAATAARRRILK